MYRAIALLLRISSVAPALSARGAHTYTLHVGSIRTLYVQVSTRTVQYSSSEGFFCILFLTHIACYVACSTCGYGNYIAANCSASRNTQCAPCTVCPSMQYPSRLCERGLNTLCNTCKLCAFVDATARKECEMDKGYFPWHQANCCVGPKGDKVACERTDRSEMLQASIDGRHHWSFASTSPRIDSARNPGIRFPNPF